MEGGDRINKAGAHLLYLGLVALAVVSLPSHASVSAVWGVIVVCAVAAVLLGVAVGPSALLTPVVAGIVVVAGVMLTTSGAAGYEGLSRGVYTTLAVAGMVTNEFAAGAGGLFRALRDTP